MSIACNITEKNVSMVLDGKPHIIPRTSGVFQQVVEAINNEDEDNLRLLLAPKAHIASFTEGRIEFDGRELRFNGETIHNSIKDRLHFLWTQGLNLKPLMRFLDNLMDNPSYRAVNETYGFLEACDLPITNDGCFLAYKMVRDSYMDIHSGTMLNAVGTRVEVPRNQIDEDSNRTCSYGLHVCSQGYLGCYGSGRNSSDRVLIVKINPADVVAVPADYNNAKMRVCGYDVVGECSWEDVGLDRFHTNNFSDDYSDDDYSDDEYDDEYDGGYGDFDEEYDEGYDDPFEDSLEEEWTPVTPTPEPLEEPTPVQAPQPPQPTLAAVGGKLTLSAVKDIKRLLAEPEHVRLSITNIAALHDINESTVRKIRDGLIHRDITL